MVATRARKIHYKHCYLAALMVARHKKMFSSEGSDSTELQTTDQEFYSKEQVFSPAKIETEDDKQLYAFYLQWIAERAGEQSADWKKHLLTMEEALMDEDINKNITRGGVLYNRGSPKSQDEIWGGFGEFCWNLYMCYFFEGITTGQGVLAAGATAGVSGFMASFVVATIGRCMSACYGEVPARLERGYARNVLEKNSKLEAALVKEGGELLTSDPTLGITADQVAGVRTALMEDLFQSRVKKLVALNELYWITRKGHVAFQGSYFVGTIAQYAMNFFTAAGATMLALTPWGWGVLVMFAAAKGIIAGATAGTVRYQLLQKQLNNDYLLEHFDKKDKDTVFQIKNEGGVVVNISKSKIQQELEKISTKHNTVIDSEKDKILHKILKNKKLIDKFDSKEGGHLFEIKNEDGSTTMLPKRDILEKIKAATSEHEVAKAEEKKKFLLELLKKDEQYIKQVEQDRDQDKSYKIRRLKNFATGAAIGVMIFTIVTLVDPLLTVINTLHMSAAALYTLFTAISSFTIWGAVAAVLKGRGKVQQAIEKDPDAFEKPALPKPTPRQPREQVQSWRGSSVSQFFRRVSRKMRSGNLGDHPRSRSN